MALSDGDSSKENSHRDPIGIDGLDNVLCGGLISNQLYLVDGNPGSGKTTLSLQFLIEGARRGEKCLYITLSETEEELRAGATSHGWDLQGIDIVELTANENDLEREAQITMYHASEVELTELTTRILDAVGRIKPDRAVFDSLSELRLLSQSSLRYRRQVLALKQFFVGRSCTVLLLDDRTAETTDLQLQSIAHGVISLEQNFPAYGNARRKLRVVKMRGSTYRGGYHDFNIEKGGLQVFPRLVAAEHSEEFKPEHIRSGIAELDAALGGGPVRGTSTLLMGPAGSGKSTVAVKYAVAAAERGDHAALFLFDESIATLQVRCQALGIDLIGGRKAGQVSARSVDPAEVSPGEFAHMVRRAVEVDKAKIIVIDSLNGYLNAMHDEPYLTPQLHELLSFLGRQGVTTFMVVAQHGLGLGTHMPSPVDTSYLADSVILHRYFEYKGRVKKAISVVKMRSGRHEETIREMTFDQNGIHLGEPLTMLRGVLTGVPVELKEASSD
jgi:circadian clock protein KaiC